MEQARPRPRIRAIEGLGALSRKLPRARNKGRIGRALAHLAGDPPAARARVSGLELWMRPAGRTVAEAFWSGSYEEDLVRVCGALLKPGSVVLDIGANVGLVGVRLAAKLRDLAQCDPTAGDLTGGDLTGGDLSGGSGRVLMFEPVPANLELLERSVAANALSTFAEVLPVGLSDRAGRVPIFVEARRGRSENAMLRRPAATGSARYGRHRVATVTAEMARLDDVMPAELLGRVDLVKVDVEGAEVACLRGGLQTIEASSPVIFGEFNAGLMPLFGTAFPDVVELLAHLDYRVFAFVSSSLMREVPAEVGRGDVALVPARRMQRFVGRLAGAEVAVEVG